MKILTIPLSQVHGFFSHFRNLLYDREQLKKIQLSLPVVSVGNLTFGGTGKTPFVDFLLPLLKAEGYRVGVVSRAYKAQAKKPQRVDPHHPNAAALFGDEPVFLAKQHPDVIFYVGSSKSQTALTMVREEKVQLIVVDDGFQHRRLNRTLDIVLLDSTEEKKNYQLFPWGRARESLKNLSRAHLLVATKCNLASGDGIPFIQQKFSETPLFEFDSVLHRIWDFHSGKDVSIESLPKPLFLFCGLGRPQTFPQLLLQVRKDFHLDQKFFPDHHLYTKTDIEKLLALKTLRQSHFLTTEKDAVKLKDLWPAQVPLAVMGLKFQLRNRHEEFVERLRQFLR